MRGGAAARRGTGLQRDGLNVAQLVVQGVDGAEHLGDVEARVPERWERIRVFWAWD